MMRRSTRVLSPLFLLSPLLLERRNVSVRGFVPPAPSTPKSASASASASGRSSSRLVETRRHVIGDFIGSEAEQVSATSWGDLLFAGMDEFVPVGPNDNLPVVDEVEVVGGDEGGGGDLEKVSATSSSRVRTDSSSRGNTNSAKASTSASLRRRTERLLRVTSPGHSSASTKHRRADRRTFHFLIDSWAFSGAPDAAEHAVSLLRRMEELGNQDQDRQDHDAASRIRPDVRSYTKVINAYARSYRLDAGQKAESILNEMLSLSSSKSNPTARPNAYTYTGVIEAYANSGHADAPINAERIVEVMQDLYEHTGEVDVRPTARSYNAVIQAWAKSDIPGSAERAERCLRRMEERAETSSVRPNTINYNAVINAWANSGAPDGAARAMSILEYMSDAHSHQQDRDRVKPNTISYNAVLDSFAKSPSRDGSAAQRAEELLLTMVDLYETGANVDAKPNVRSFNSVINAWAKSGRDDAAYRAEDVLDRMERLHRMSVEAKGDDDDADDGYNNDDDGEKEGSPPRNKKRSVMYDCKPDAVAYATVINAWARSHKFGKADRVLNIYRRMRHVHETTGDETVRPNVVIYNSVMNACAFTVGDWAEQSRAVEIAHLMLRTLEDNPDHGRPDQVTYGTFLKVCNNQMSDSDTRRKVVELVFEKCKRDGQVGTMVLRQLGTLCSEETYRRLLQGLSLDEDVDVEDLPVEWRCNVVEGKWRRRRKMNCWG